MHEQRRLKVVIAGGGSGGHISPAIAVIGELRRRTEIDPLWIGSKREYEGAAATEIGVPFRRVRAGKLRRYLSLATIADTFRVPLGTWQALRILKAFRPDVVVSTGGFVSVPSVIASRMLGIPSITHEQTAHIGLATRINARFCDVIALSFERSKKALPRTRAKVVVTGNPVRRTVLEGDARRALRQFELSGTLPLIYVTGGAQGARAINAVIGASLEHMLCRAEVIHQCGPRSLHSDYEDLKLRASQLPIELRQRYRVCERVGSELGDIYAAASLVIGRAGAGTVAELAAVGLPSILIPLPGAEEQRQNALFLVDAGAAVMLSQDELNADTLPRLVASLVSDPGKLEDMGQAARSAAALEPAKRLADEILRLATVRDDQASA